MKRDIAGLTALLASLPLIFIGCDIEPKTIAGFGDSMTAHIQREDGSWANFSYIVGLNELVEPFYVTEEFGLPQKSCPSVRDEGMIPELERTEYRKGDVVVLMCHTILFVHTPLWETVLAVEDMESMIKETGAKFVFASQPAWYRPTAWNHASRTFYDTLFPRLSHDTLIIDNDALWKEMEYDLDISNYTDGIHMSEKGAQILTDTLYETLCDEGMILCKEDIEELFSEYINRTFFSRLRLDRCPHGCRAGHRAR
jgi:hypothetical protein